MPQQQEHYQPVGSVWLVLAAMFMPPLLLIAALPPLNLWPLAFIALVPLFYLSRQSAVGFWRLSWSSVIAGGLYWAVLNHQSLVGQPYPWLHVATPTAWAIAAGIFVVLAIGAGIGWAFYTWLARRIMGRLSIGPAIGLASLTWAALEVVRSFIYWNLSLGIALGYSLPASSWFGQPASLGGVWLIGLGIVVVNWLITELILSVPQHRLAITGWLVGVLIVWVAVGGGLAAWLKADSGSAKVEAVAIQTHRQLQSDGGDSARYDQQVIAAQASAPTTGQRLIVLPEDAFAIDAQGQQHQTMRPAQIVYSSLGNLVSASFQRLASKTTLVAGFVDTTNPKAWYNGAVVLDRQNYYGAAYKRNLMPFGEYLPLAKSWPATLQTQFLYQTSQQPALVTSTIGTISHLFCNELFQPVLAQSDAYQGASVIAGLASDYDVATPWFAAWQIRAASYRAVETWRPLVLAADQTQSAVIDASGKVLNQGAYQHDQFVTGIVSRVSRPSPWARWQPFWRPIIPLSFLWLVFVLIITSQATRQSQIGRD